MAKANGATKEKKAPSINREDFKKFAEALLVELANGSGTFKALADTKEFSTGSYGWGFNGPAIINVGDKPVKCQIGLNITVAHSKEE